MKSKKGYKTTLRYLRSTPVMVTLAAGVCVLALVLAPFVRADSYQDQINALNANNSNIQSELQGLEGQASNYQTTVDNLQAQINSLSASLDANEAEQTTLQGKISANQSEIATQKSILANDIKTMYLSSGLTPIEMLATSDDLSQYVDQQVAYEAVQNKIESTVTEINALQVKLKDQETQVDALVQTQKTQDNLLISDQNQVNSLLSYNQQQQDQYNSQISSNNKQISALEAEQVATNEALAISVGASIPSSGSGGACDGYVHDVDQGNGGYPAVLCDAGQDQITDNDGFPNRECTSFANWYFTVEEGQSGFSPGKSNAGWWYLTSNYPSITWSGGVTPGAIGVEPSSSLNAPVPTLHTSIDGGYYGHVMIVLALPGTTYDGSFPYTSNMAGTQVPAGDVLVMSMNEDGSGHFLYDFWPINYLMYINPQ